MSMITIFLAQTKGGAAIEILSLLLVSAIIGYITAWLYYKSVYKRKIKDVESEKHELNNRIVNLNRSIGDLQKNLSEKDNEIELLNIAQSKRFLDYNSFGTATKAEKDDLKMISGIGGWIKEKLNVLDIYTFKQISNFTAEDVQLVTDIIEYFPVRIERDEWIYQAGELVRIAGNKAEVLEIIPGRIEKDDWIGQARELAKKQH
ncbi:MAG: hypothetical protein A2V64_06790 [Bacteroidetes bacterium RBG_13_43_22]|nr:MAG: hypothetical protein A2V64_06790 [Bacteroidetes bacterium RBG_13_43_22]